MAPKRSLKAAGSNDNPDESKKSKKLKSLSKSDSTNVNHKAPHSDGETRKEHGRKDSKKSESHKNSSLVKPSATPKVNREKQLELNKQLLEAVKLNIKWKGDLELVKQLVKKGADVNAKDEKGNPVLVEALGENWDFVEFLLESGANPNCKRADGVEFSVLALSWTIGGDSTYLLEIVLDAGAKMNYVEDGEKVCPLIWAAINTGQENIIDFVLDRGADVTVLDHEGGSVLAHLVQLQSDDVVMHNWELEKFKTKYLKVLKSHGAKFTKADKKAGHHKTSSWKEPISWGRWAR